jgi:hypothetical protein
VVIPLGAPQDDKGPRHKYYFKTRSTRTMTENLKSNRKLIWIGRGISILATLPFVVSAVMKLKVNPQVIQGLVHLGLPNNLLITLAILEILCIILYDLPHDFRTHC